MILPIIKYPNPVLTKKTRKIKVEEIKSPEVKELILDMLETMDANNGIGLAATQVGQSLRICVLKSARENGKTYILINPKFKSKSWKKEVAEEGCLSFPGKYIPVKRSASVKVEALDRNGKKILINGTGILARVLQHEIDHLDGVLFIKREVKKPKTEF